ncbi:SMP-30/gluconolactonase/LRE family protein [Ensifer soli]|uniref:SMP-30/gluconolactonase/LRE family protein n=1 Tax=Ciceribacter sp. sgz301302 TaxID=3342379 RepID=UPI0035B98B41
MTDIQPFSGTLLCEANSILGEGPTYDETTGIVWWVNIKGRELHELHLKSGRKSVHALPFMASVIARIDPERQLLATDAGLYLRQTETGDLSFLSKVEDAPANRSNDGRVHPSGSLWLGTMGKGAESGAGAIYHIAQGRVTKLYGNITVPNAICFSPDGATAYFADSDVNHLMRVDLDPATGLPTGDATVLSDETGSDGVLDGSVCDADGLIWNARWGGWSVDVYKPDGSKVARHAIPTGQPSCPAFIGPDAARLLVTSAWQDMDDATRAKDVNAGRTFDLGIAVRGRFEPVYKL